MTDRRGDANQELSSITHPALTFECLSERIVPVLDPFQEPELLASQDGVLDVTLMQTVGPAMVGDVLAENVWTYNGELSAPLLQANPGDTMRINVVNDLPQQTNLHTHGLHVSPLGNSDNVLIQIDPGESFQYEFDIPDDHPDGTHWYHPHRHGLVNEQVAKGQAGMLVIGRADGGFPELDGLVQNHLVIQHTWVQDGEVRVPPDGEFHDEQIITVNGQLNPLMTIQPGGWRVFNIVNAGSDAFYRLQLIDSTAPEEPIPWLAVARDGQPFSTVGNPRPAGNPATLGMPTGSRWSVLVKAPDNPVPGQEYTLETIGFGPSPGNPDPTNVWPARTLMTIRFEGEPWDAPTGFVAPQTGSTLQAPNNLFRDLRVVEPTEIAAYRVAEFSDENGFQLINAQAYPNNPVFQPRIGTIEEWTLVNSSSQDHPFHFHTNPQQVISGPGPVGAQGLGIWQDIVNIPAGTTVTIRIEFQEFLGDVVYHCHRLIHEDHGMMAGVTMIPNDPIFAVSVDEGSPPVVEIISPVTNEVVSRFFAFDPSFLGGVSTAIGDVNKDGFYDVVVGAGPGAGPHVKVIDGTKLDQIDENGVISDSALFYSFYAFDQSFRGGVSVSGGDINLDGFCDLVVGAGAGAGPHVRAFNAVGLAELASFYAYDPSFSGGVRVAAGDIVGDGFAAIITGAGFGGPPHLRVIDSEQLNNILPTGEIAVSALMANFMAFDPDFLGGVFVGAGQITGFGYTDMIVGSGTGARGNIKIYGNVDDDPLSHVHHHPNIEQLDSFFAFEDSYLGGVRVSSMKSQELIAPFNTSRDNVVASPAVGDGLIHELFGRTIAPPPLPTDGHSGHG
ncbi:Blue copper oxidase CueO precursor [Planctomycetes bacterium Pan216]|uniref:Blue copper oxidase CueO n=1 Tax=Kolteria novifilia TaxID=2527975 RepID=A0A518B438_9BACT|nr:Blue copper oxidase CueO precursor [Planctomycetes bacterium Pan216]